MSLIALTCCFLFFCLKCLARCLRDCFKEHFASNWFYSPRLLQFFPHARHSFLLFMCRLPQNLHRMTGLPPFSVSLTSSEALDFDFSSETNLRSSWLPIACNCKAVASLDLQMSIPSGQGKFRLLKNTLRSAIVPYSNNNPVTYKTI